MLLSLGLIVLCGILLGGIAEKLRLPRLLGMLIAGIILGPFGLNLLGSEIINISTELRQIALIIILTRAGLALDLKDLAAVGRPAILMCFLPACLEILGTIIFATALFGLSIAEAALLGSVIAAVSPAVAVPKMIKLIEEGYGTDKKIPQLIMAGASVDDVFVIVLFTALLSFFSGTSISAVHLLAIPTSILLGIFAGIATGFVLNYIFERIHMRDSLKVLIILGTSFLLLSAEQYIESYVGFSGLLAVMGIGTTIKKMKSPVATRLSVKFNKVWVFAELLLFVLVGASVNIYYAFSEGMTAVFLLFVILLFRMLGVYLCMFKTQLTYKERIFCMFAYMPKATVQAAIGTIPLSMGLKSGEIILTIAVLSILITAPLGSFAIDYTYKKFLNTSKRTA